MKAIGLLSLIITMGIVAWLVVNQQKPAGSDQSTAEAAISKGKRVQAKAQLLTVQSAVDQFRIMEGRLPENLSELESKGYLDRSPSGLDYDAVAGKVSVANP